MTKILSRKIPAAAGPLGRRRLPPPHNATPAPRLQPHRLDRVGVGAVEQLDNYSQRIEQKFAKKPVIVEANLKAMAAGHAYAETVEIFQVSYKVAPAKMPPPADNTALSHAGAGHAVGRGERSMNE